jgi:uncharacterized membrane protein YfcA
VLAFGSAGVLIVSGTVCGVLVGGLTGQLLTIALLSLGFGAVVLLLFLEVGLSEDRARARDQERERRRERDLERDRERERERHSERDQGRDRLKRETRLPRSRGPRRPRRPG